MGLSPIVSVMRNPSILSATPPSASSTLSSTPSPARAPGSARADSTLFDACQIGVVLRAVLFVELVVGVATLFLAPTLAEWLLLAATVTGGAERNILVVTERDDDITWKSLRNVPAVHLLAEDQLNTYDVLVSDHVVFTEAALSAFVERG